MRPQMLQLHLFGCWFNQSAGGGGTKTRMSLIDWWFKALRCDTRMRSERNESNHALGAVVVELREAVDVGLAARAADRPGLPEVDRRDGLLV